MIKKVISVLLAAVCVAVLLAGCGKSESAKDEKTGNVTLGDYKNLEVTVGKSEVNDSAVQSYIERMIGNYVSDDSEQPTYSELTDEFVATNMQDTGCKTVAELSQMIKDYLNGLNEYYAENNIRSEIIEKLSEICTVKEIPQELLDERTAMQERLFKINCQEKYGMDFEEYLASYKATEKSFHEQTVASVKEKLETVLIIRAIAEREKITVTDSEIKKYAEEMTGSYGYENAEKLYSDYGESYIEDECLGDKVIEELMKSVKIIYVSPGELTEK